MLEHRSFCSFKLLLLMAQFKFKFFDFRNCFDFVPLVHALLSPSTMFRMNSRSAGVYLSVCSGAAAESGLLATGVFGGARLYRSMADLLCWFRIGDNSVSNGLAEASEHDLVRRSGSCSMVNCRTLSLLCINLSILSIEWSLTGVPFTSRILSPIWSDIKSLLTSSLWIEYWICYNLHRIYS